MLLIPLADFFPENLIPLSDFLSASLIPLSDFLSASLIHPTDFLSVVSIPTPVLRSVSVVSISNLPRNSEQT